MTARTKDRTTLRSLYRSLYRTGVGVAGVTFDGASAIYDTNEILTSPPFTMACWTVVPSVNGDAVVSLGSSADEYHALYMRASSCRASSGGIAGSYSEVSLGKAIGEIVHVAGVWESDTSRLAYADGVAGVENTDSEPATTINSFIVGDAEVGGSTRASFETIYHAAWWNEALDADEIAELAAGANPRTIRPWALTRYLPMAGAANAASEIIQPHTWTTVGTLEDGGSAASDPVDGYVDPGALQHEYRGYQEGWIHRHSNTTTDFNAVWDTNYGDSTDSWALSQKATDHMLHHMRESGYNSITVKSNYGNGCHWPVDPAIWHERGGTGNYAAIRPTNDEPDPMLYYVTKARELGFRVGVDVMCTRHFDSYYDGTEQVPGEGLVDDFITGSPAPGSNYDLDNATFVQRLVDRVVLLGTNYDLDFIDLDFLRSGLASVSDRIRWQGIVEGIQADIRTGLDAAGKTNIVLSVWGHPSADRINQGQNSTKSVNDGLVDYFYDGNYGFAPEDTTAILDHAEVALGVITDGTYGGDPDTPLDPLTDKEGMRSMYGGDYRSGYNSGTQENDFMLAQHSAFMVNLCRLQSPNTGSTFWGWNKFDEDVILGHRSAVFDNRNQALAIYNPTYRGDAPTPYAWDQWERGKLFYRNHNSGQFIYNADGTVSTTTAADHALAAPVEGRVVKNEFRSNIVTGSEDIATAALSGTAAHVSGNTFQFNDADDYIQLTNAQIASGGQESPQGFYVTRMEVTTDVDNAVFRITNAESGNFFSTTITLGVAGTYKICSDPWEYRAGGSTNVHSLRLYGNRNGVTTEVEITKICISAGNGPSEYVANPSVSTQETQTFTTENATTETANIVTDAVGAEIVPLISGPQILDESIVGLAEQPMDKKQVDATISICPTFAGTDDKGSDIVVIGGQADTDDYWEVRLDQTTNTVEFEKAAAGNTPIIISTNIGYSANDTLTITAQASTTNGMILTVNNDTTDFYVSASDADTTEFRNSMMTFVGSRLGYDSSNQSMFHMRYVAHGNEYDSTGVAFGGSEQIYKDTDALTDVPMSMACWTKAGTGNNVLLMAAEDASAADRWHSMLTRNGKLDIYSNEGAEFHLSSYDHSYAAGTVFHAAGVWDSDSLRTAYVDGDAATPDTNTLSVSGIDRLTVGAGSASSRYYDEEIYYPTFWKTALSATDVARLAAGTPPWQVKPWAIVSMLPLDGEARAAEEMVVPDQALLTDEWTTVGTLADGSADTTVQPDATYADTVIDVKIGVHQEAINTSTGVQTFTNANLDGKTPKAALAFLTNATVADTVTADMMLSVGATDGTTDVLTSMYSEDNVSPSNPRRYHSAINFLGSIDGPSLESAASFDSFSANSTAANFTNASPEAYLASLVQFAGDDLKAETGSVDVETTKDAAVTVTLNNGTLEPDLILFFYPAYDTPESVVTSNANSFGFATNESGGITNHCVSKFELAGANPTSMSAIVRNNRCGGVHTHSANSLKYFEVTSITAGGFDLTTRDSIDASARDIQFLALSFGGAQVKAGTIETPTDDTVDWEVTGVGFQPQFVFSAWTAITGAYNTVKADGEACSLNLWAFDANGAGSAAVRSQDAVATTSTDSRTGSDLLVRDNTGTTLVDLDTPVFNSDGWTVAAADIDVADGTARQGIYFAVEDVS